MTSNLMQQSRLLALLCGSQTEPLVAAQSSKKSPKFAAWFFNSGLGEPTPVKQANRSTSAQKSFSFFVRCGRPVHRSFQEERPKARLRRRHGEYRLPVGSIVS